MTLAVLETGAEMGGAQQTTAGTFAKNMRIGLRVITIISIPILWNFPAAVFCFWATNNTFSLLQLLVLRQEPVRQYLGLPKKNVPTPEEVQGSGKPLKFWESVSAGKSSQTANSRAQQNRLPSVLQQQRQLDSGREAALQKILQDQNQGQSSDAVIIPTSATTVTASPIAAEQTRNEAHHVGRPNKQAEAKEAKRRRIQAAREKRASRGGNL
jgi:hypothetical protein